MFRHQLGALTLLAAFALPLAASAQTAPGPQAAAPGLTAPAAHAHRGPRHHHHNRYLHALHAMNLSDAQKQQIGGYLKTAREASRQARVASARALRRQIDGVLTPDQRTQLRTALAHTKRAPGAPGGGSRQPAQ